MRKPDQMAGVVPAWPTAPAGRLDAVLRRRPGGGPAVAGLLLAAGWLLCGAATALAAGAGQGPAPADSTAPEAAAPADSAVFEAGTWSLESQGMPIDEQISNLNLMLLSDPRNAELYDTLGQLYLAKQQWSLARDAFLSAVQINRRVAAYHRDLGLALARLGTQDLALREFQVYQQEDAAGAPDAWRLIGEAWRASGDADQARDAFEKGIKKLGKDQAEERLRLALSLSDLLASGQDQEQSREVLEEHLDAARALIAAAADTSRSIDAEPARQLVRTLQASYLAEAKRLGDAKEPAQAAPFLVKAYGLAPERSELMLGAVGAYLAAGQRDEAKEAVRRAQADRPDDSGLWLAAGTIAEDEGQLPEAIDTYKKALAGRPRDLDLQRRIGSLCLKVGDSAGAAKYLGTDVSDPSTPPEVLHNYAVALLREQKYSLAIAPLRRAVKLAPGMGSAWSALGTCLQQTNNLAEAADAYAHALAIAPDPRILFNRALCLSQIGRGDEAIAAYQEAIQLDPAFKEARYNLGKALYDAKRYEEAIAALQEALKADPESYASYFMIGLSLHQLGRFRDAIEAYNGALARKETPEAFQNMGIAYDRLGKKEEAAKCYQEARRLEGKK